MSYMIPISKYSSKASGKKAKNINWNAAEKSILDRSDAISGRELSRDEVILELSKNKLFSDEDIESITNIEIEQSFKKILNKNELIFLEIGGYLTDSLHNLGEIKDYLVNEKNIRKPGDLSELMDLEGAGWQETLNDSEEIKSRFNQLNSEQVRWHEESQVAGGDDSDRYMTDEVFHEFDSGWKVVYVPAVGEGPLYKHFKDRSNDRTVEGNKMGICLGLGSGLYQTNSEGEIYSVRDPSNNPHVTIRIHKVGRGNRLIEAKGKHNASPSVAGAIHAKSWFELLNKTLDGGLDYTRNQDYKNFPPTSEAEVLESIRSERPDNLNAFLDGWASSWYKKGIKEFDEMVTRLSKEKHPALLHSGINKKQKEDMSEIFEYWAERYIEHGDLTLFYKSKKHYMREWSLDLEWGVDESGEFGWGKGGDKPNLNYDMDGIYQITDHGGLGTYKKEPWMKEAVNKLISSISKNILDTPLYGIDDSNPIFKAESTNGLPKHIRSFFSQREAGTKALGHEYEVGWEKIRYLPFLLGLHKTDEYDNEELKNILKLSFQIDKAKESDPDIGDDYPRGSASDMYFKHKLYDSYPDLMSEAIDGIGILIFEQSTMQQLISAGATEEDIIKKESELIGDYVIKFPVDFFDNEELYRRHPNLHDKAALSYITSEDLSMSPEDFFIDDNIPGKPGINISDRVISFVERRIITDPPTRASSHWKELNYFMAEKLYEKHTDLEERMWELYIGKPHSHNYEVQWEERVETFFKLNKHKSFKSVTKQILEAELPPLGDPTFIFRMGLDHEFAEMAQISLESLIENIPWTFFDLLNNYPTSVNPVESRFSLEKRYPGYTHLAAKNLFEKEPSWFNSYNLYEKYPEAVEGLIENIIDENPENFFHQSRFELFTDDLYAEMAINNMSEKRYGTAYIAEATQFWALKKEYEEGRTPIGEHAVGELTKSRLSLLTKYTFFPLLAKFYKTTFDLDIEKILRKDEISTRITTEDVDAEPLGNRIHQLREEDLTAPGYSDDEDSKEYNFKELFDEYKEVPRDDAGLEAEPEDDYDRENYSYDTKSKIKQLSIWLHNNGFKKESREIEEVLLKKKGPYR